uniref:Peptidase A1 domain-containing protein n=1 Tax=Oryza meridionalis TaxID=40149 RepID=A0A0E0FAC4_9ORYZ
MAATGDAAAVRGGVAGGQWGRGGGGRNGAWAPPPPATHEAGHEAAWAASTGSFPADGLVGLGGGGLPRDAARRAHRSAGDSPTASSRTPSTSRRRSTSAPSPTSPSPARRAYRSSPGHVDTYYTVVLDSVKVGTKTVASSRIIVDSGTTLTFLDPALMGPLVGELSRRCSRRTGCCSCATSCLGRRWKPERESQITSINISRSPETPSWNLVQIITVLM